MYIMRADTYGEPILDKVTVEKMMRECLDDEEVDILHHIFVDEYPYEKIGEIIGAKYRNKLLTGSGIRFLRDRIYAKLRAYMESNPE